MPKPPQRPTVHDLALEQLVSKHLGPDAHFVLAILQPDATVHVCERANARSRIVLYAGLCRQIARALSGMPADVVTPSEPGRG